MNGDERRWRWNGQWDKKGEGGRGKAEDTDGFGSGIERDINMGNVWPIGVNIGRLLVI